MLKFPHLILLSLFSISFAYAETVERVYQGQTEKESSCQVNINHIKGSHYVLKTDGGSRSSTEPFPGARLEHYEYYNVSGITGNYNVVEATLENNEIEEFLNGKDGIFRIKAGGQFNAGLGKTDIRLNFQNGNPIEGRFKNSFFFSKMQDFECNNLIQIK
jgi:hypothetical protein